MNELKCFCRKRALITREFRERFEAVQEQRFTQEFLERLREGLRTGSAP